MYEVLTHTKRSTINFKILQDIGLRIVDFDWMRTHGPSSTSFFFLKALSIWCSSGQQESIYIY